MTSEVVSVVGIRGCNKICWYLVDSVGEDR